MATGPSRPTMITSTTLCSIHPSSASTTGRARRMREPNSRLHGFCEGIQSVYFGSWAEVLHCGKSNTHQHKQEPRAEDKHHAGFDLDSRDDRSTQGDQEQHPQREGVERTEKHLQPVSTLRPKIEARVGSH